MKTYAKNYSKKHKKNHKRNKYYTKKNFKYRGGQLDLSNKMNEKITNISKTIPNNLTVEQIKNQIKNENSLKNFLPTTNINNSEIINKATELSKGLGVKVIEQMGDIVGIDIDNPQQTNERLQKIKENLSDPKNIENVKEIASNFAELGAVGIEAAKPFVEPLVDSTINKLGDVASKLGENGVKIALNTAEEIPGVGVFIGTLRSLSNLGEAGLSVMNTGTEIIKDSSDTLNATTKNFKQLIKQKQSLLDRTQNSIDKFMNPTNNYISNLESTRNSINNMSSSLKNNLSNNTHKLLNTKIGGKTKKYHKIS